jgi:Fe-S cluster assembly iron-binding protein IscA
MALDEPTDNDEIYENEKFNVIIDKALLTQLGGVTIDFKKSSWMGGGFSVEAANGEPASSCSC